MKLVTVINILADHRYFLAVFCLMTILLLVRIPMGTFNESSYLDTIGHFLLPASGAPLVYAVMSRTGAAAFIRSRKAILAIILTGTILELAWELLEFGIDHQFGLNWQPSTIDTLVDIGLAIIGSAAGGWAYVRHHRPDRNLITTMRS